MHDDVLQVPAQLTKIISMARRAVRLQFDTNENLSDLEMANLMASHEKFGHVVFAIEKSVSKEDVLNLPPLVLDKEEKSPGTRLRGSLYRLWEAKGKPTETFEEFYRVQMERIINNVQQAIQ